VDEVWLVRHGQTEWSRERRHTGRTDLPLTTQGEDAARALGKRLADVDFDLVLASPLKRAWRTAELAGMLPVAEPRLMEWDYGDYEGLTSEEIREKVPDWSLWSHPIPGGESIEQVAARADAVLADVRARPGRRCLVVAHGHVLRVLTTRWIDEPPRVGAHFALDTATIGVLALDRGEPVVQRWNA
jgi:broad specificity phosphatase PhoE